MGEDVVSTQYRIEDLSLRGDGAVNETLGELAADGWHLTQATPYVSPVEVAEDALSTTEYERRVLLVLQRDTVVHRPSEGMEMSG